METSKKKKAKPEVIIRVTTSVPFFPNLKSVLEYSQIKTSN